MRQENEIQHTPSTRQNDFFHLEITRIGQLERRISAEQNRKCKHVSRLPQSRNLHNIADSRSPGTYCPTPFQLFKSDNGNYLIKFISGTISVGYQLKSSSPCRAAYPQKHPATCLHWRGQQELVDASYSPLRIGRATRREPYGLWEIDRDVNETRRDPFDIEHYVICEWSWTPEFCLWAQETRSALCIKQGHLSPLTHTVPSRLLTLTSLFSPAKSTIHVDQHSLCLNDQVD